MRRVKRYPCEPGRNSMRDWHRKVHPLRVIFQFIIITVCRYLPSLKMKNFLYRRLGMKVGKNVSMGVMVMVDIFFPQFVSIGDNSVIGYNSTILAHVLLGANTTVLPGVKIGDGARVGAGSLVNRDIPPGVLACGVPAKVREN